MTNKTWMMGVLVGLLAGCAGEDLSADGFVLTAGGAGLAGFPVVLVGGGAGQTTAGQAGAPSAGTAGTSSGQAGQQASGQAGAEEAGQAGSSPVAGAGGSSAGAAGGAGVAGSVEPGGQAGAPAGQAGVGGTDAGQAGATAGTGGSSGAGAGGSAAGVAGQAGAGQAGESGAAGSAGSPLVCELGKQRCQGPQPQVCDGTVWNPYGGSCTYGCDGAAYECVCSAPSGRYVEVTHAYNETGSPGGVVYRKAVKDTVTGLTWFNEIVPTATFSKVAEFCENSGGRLPTRAEVRAIQSEQYPAVSCASNLPEPFKVTGTRLWTVDGESALPGTRYTIHTTTAKEEIKAEGDLAAFRCVHDPF